MGGGVGGGRALGVVRFQAAAQLRPGVASRALAGWVGAQLGKMGIESTMARLGQTPVGLPRAH
jgi:hypothetical protein